MPNNKEKMNNSLIFPENNASIIRGILKKYKLQESNKEILEKWRGGKKDFGTILADLIIKTSRENLSSLRLTTLIQEELSINNEKAKKINEDLNKEILSFVNKITKKYNPAQKTTPISIGELLLSDKNKKRKEPKK